MSRDGKPGLIITGGRKEPGEAQGSLPVENVTGGIGHDDVIGAIAVQVSSQRSGVGGFS